MRNFMKADMRELLHKIRIKLGLYDLETEGAKWVAKNLGEEFVDEFKENCESINKGIPIGGFVETAAFLELVDTIKKEL